MTFLHLLDEAMAWLASSLISSEKRFHLRQSWHCCSQGVRLAEGLQWNLGHPTQASFRSRVFGNRRWPVYQGLLSQPWQ